MNRTEAEPEPAPLANETFFWKERQHLEMTPKGVIIMRRKDLPEAMALEGQSVTAPPSAP